MDSGGDVSCVRLLLARRRGSVPSVCNVVAERSGHVAVYMMQVEATQWIAVDRSGTWWGPKDVELVIQDPVYYFQ